jgi:hypothetical protein
MRLARWPGLLLIIACLGLMGCLGSPAGTKVAPVSQPVAPLIGEPALVRVHTGKVMLVSSSSPLAPGEEQSPDAGFRFIAVGFPIGQEQVLAVDDYEVDANEEDLRLPFAVGGENAQAPELFYDPVDFAESVSLSNAAAETTTVQGQGPDESPLLVEWKTPASTLLLLYEVPLDRKTVTLRHGPRSIRLDVETGLIDGKAGRK